MAILDGLEWLEYEGQTARELIALAGEYRTDSLCAALECALDAKQERGGELTDAEMVLLTVEAIEGEVNNGGYHQFFLNSSHVYAPIAVESLSLIGCPVTADLTRRAIDALGLEDVTPESVRKAIFQEDGARDAILDECDQGYYSSGEDVAAQLFAFVKANAGQFSS